MLAFGFICFNCGRYGHRKENYPLKEYSKNEEMNIKSNEANKMEMNEKEVGQGE